MHTVVSVPVCIHNRCTRLCLCLCASITDAHRNHNSKEEKEKFEDGPDEDIPKLGNEDIYESDDEGTTRHESSSEEEDGCYVVRDKERLNSRYEDSCNKNSRATNAGEERLKPKNVDKKLWVFTSIDSSHLRQV